MQTVPAEPGHHSWGLACRSGSGFGWGCCPAEGPAGSGDRRHCSTPLPQYPVGVLCPCTGHCPECVGRDSPRRMQLRWFVPALDGAGKGHRFQQPWCHSSRCTSRTLLLKLDRSGCIHRFWLEDACQGRKQVGWGGQSYHEKRQGQPLQQCAYCAPCLSDPILPLQISTAYGAMTASFCAFFHGALSEASLSSARCPRRWHLTRVPRELLGSLAPCSRADQPRARGQRLGWNSWHTAPHLSPALC